VYAWKSTDNLIALASAGWFAEFCKNSASPANLSVVAEPFEQQQSPRQQLSRFGRLPGAPNGKAKPLQRRRLPMPVAHGLPDNQGLTQAAQGIL